nr:HTTM domain-containing protein [Olivibacter sitiensis]
MLARFLFQKIDNAQIIVFRIFLGILIMAECWGAILTGWVKKVFVDPAFTFTFFGFEWTQFLLGQTMYYYFVVLGILGLLIALGLFYRASMLLFAIGWSIAYLMQKTHYNNHYYLLMLVCWIMVFIPAHRYLSLDVGRHPHMKSPYTCHWNRLLFIAQLLILYVFAAIAKIYPGWYTGQYLHLRFGQSAHWFRQQLDWQKMASLLENEHFALIVSWIGIGFDFLIIPLLLWRRTRVVAFVAALIFHLFNSITLQIGIFPYFALALSIFCFPPESIRKLFLPRKIPFKTINQKPDTSPSRRQKAITLALSIYILWQVYLPLRHWFIPGDVLWTEEGHRLAWRMMLRTKSATVQFWITDKHTGKKELVDLNKYLTRDQRHGMGAAPDMIWQFAQHLKKQYRENGKDIAIYVHAKVSINGSAYYDFINSETDLAHVKWGYFSHQDWILDPPEKLEKPSEGKLHRIY